MAAPGTLRWQEPADGRPPAPAWETESAVHAEAAEAVCPGLGVDFDGLAAAFVDRSAFHHSDLGYWNGAWVAHSASAAVLEQASSGGVMTEIASHLLESGRVKGVVATRMRYGPPGPRPETFLARSRAELMAAQGSKYCPVPAAAALANLEAQDAPVAFVGTPCQIAAIRSLQRARPEWGERVPFLIGNFCGGFRDFREMHRLIRKHGLDPARVVRFRYRGGGQPGSLLMEDDSGRIVTRPYPDYVRETGFTKLRRCLLCVDATAELADFSCGDAWLERFTRAPDPWSIVMARTHAAKDVFEAMIRQGAVVAAAISADEIRQSQAVNLKSKKHRQHARRRLYRLLGIAVPQHCGGFPLKGGSIAFEAFVTFCHHVSEKAENGSVAYKWLQAAGLMAKKPLKCLRRRLQAARGSQRRAKGEEEKAL